MHRFRNAAAITAIIGVLTMSSASAEPRTERQSYQLGVSASAAALTGPGNVNGVMFELIGSEQWMHIRIEDDFGFVGPVGGVVEFVRDTDPVGTLRGEDVLEGFWFCGRRDWMAVPAGSERVRVTFDSSVARARIRPNGPEAVQFHPCSAPSPARAGDVVASFL